MRVVSRIARVVLPRPILRRLEREYTKEAHINRALTRFRGETTYLEIGVKYGLCIRQIRATRRIAIDPAFFEPDNPLWQDVVIHQLTSDDYFRDIASSELADRPVNVALVDGLHEFRQALRDVLNLERFMSPKGVVFIHDCNPPTRGHAENVHGNKDGAWNGDVWKVSYYLQQYRPDLRYFTLQCDFGVGVVSGFSRNPPTPDEREIERVAALDYEVLARDRKRVLNLRSPLLARPG